MTTRAGQLGIHVKLGPRRVAPRRKQAAQPSGVLEIDRQRTPHTFTAGFPMALDEQAEHVRTQRVDPVDRSCARPAIRGIVAARGRFPPAAHAPAQAYLQPIDPFGRRQVELSRPLPRMGPVAQSNRPPHVPQAFEVDRNLDERAGQFELAVGRDRIASC